MYTKDMAQKLSGKARPKIGDPFEREIIETLFPLTNTGNISSDWDLTAWVRYSIAEQIKKVKPLPDDCKALLKPFYRDLDL